ncbi:MAG: hypothetical protein HWE26_17465 [Alteromonadaceae bacterium]|nr:hypothetical protein [Alteromonadaceae bacterium]
MLSKIVSLIVILSALYGCTNVIHEPALSAFNDNDSFASFATETYVLSGQIQHIEHSDGSKESLVSELLLNNCNINLKTVLAKGSTRISITFSDRRFEAEGLSIKSDKNGACRLALTKGKGIR